MKNSEKRYSKMSNSDINVTRLKGNLGGNPEEAKTSQGKTYTKVALFYQPIPFRKENEDKAKNLEPVIFHLRFYNGLAQQALHELKESDFLNITAGQLRIARDKKDGEPIFLVTVFDYKIVASKGEKDESQEDNQKESNPKESQKRNQWKKGSDSE